MNCEDSVEAAGKLGSGLYFCLYFCVIWTPFAVLEWYLHHSRDARMGTGLLLFAVTLFAFYGFLKLLKLSRRSRLTK
jgi:hypothetical protein